MRNLQHSPVNTANYVKLSFLYLIKVFSRRYDDSSLKILNFSLFLLEDGSLTKKKKHCWMSFRQSGYVQIMANKKNVHLSSFQTPPRLFCLHWLEKASPVFLQSFSSASLRPDWLSLPTGSCRACSADRLTLITAQSLTINSITAKMLNLHKTRPHCRKDNRKSSCCEYWPPQRRPLKRSSVAF